MTKLGQLLKCKINNTGSKLNYAYALSICYAYMYICIKFEIEI